jgi:hypothetical protein
MVWKRLFGRGQEPPAHETPAADPGAVGRRRPRAADPSLQARLDQLRRRREMAVFDLERAEAARRPDNPWRERIDLLARSLTTIEDDLRAIDEAPVRPGVPLPQTPIADLAVDSAEPAAIAFTIGGERFLFEEEPDWDQRGGPVVRGQLQQRTGDAEALIPSGLPPERHESLARHLADSVTVFAVDLRDRALEGEPLPESPTLADLARPCPECGGWRDWRGVCDACAARAFQRQSLQGEAARLAQERDEEEADRGKWAERLPVARKRLAELDAEIAKIEER